MASNHIFTFQDLDATSGRVINTYILTPTNTGDGSNKDKTLRLDEIPPEAKILSSRAGEDQSTQKSKGGILPVLSVSIYVDFILAYLKTLFLPTGYPFTVTEDYTLYQIYDSIQAFASSIAGLLSSRAVLQSLNIVSPSTTSLNSDEDHGGLPTNSASAATAATLLSILQSTLSNITTIIFASHAAPRISRDVKFYRFLADVVNDAAFLLDLLAPMLPTSSNLPFSLTLPILSSLPISHRTLVLCASSMLRAICGVAGGSSKAVLSSHFARNNPEAVGDLNAKDGSQETVVNLMGMWVGGLVVSRVESVFATWCWMLFLLGVHLWANYTAVKSVRLRSLNKQRATAVVGSIVAEELWKSSNLENWHSDSRWKELSVDNLGSRESILGIRQSLKNLLRTLLTFRPPQTKNVSCQIGVSIQELFTSLHGTSRHGSGSFRAEDVGQLLSIFERESYILWLDDKSNKTVVVLKQNSSPRDQFKAFLHAYRVQNICHQETASRADDRRFTVIANALAEVNDNWDGLYSVLERLGWNLSSTDLDDGKGIRVNV